MERLIKRSTPAHAGNTSGSQGGGQANKVYPRPRGEYAAGCALGCSPGGLPPPTRGILAANSLRDIVARSTPAHAGNTSAIIAASASPTVYPRPRGEYEAYQIARRLICGLPPPTRGIHTFKRAEGVYKRSTPAHAGNTLPAICTGCRLWVYPRPRGEYLGLRALALSYLGLPPPTRGIQRSSHCLTAPIRSTPAHAGNTPSARISRAISSVYPRPRGEYIS